MTIFKVSTRHKVNVMKTIKFAELCKSISNTTIKIDRIITTSYKKVQRIIANQINLN